MGYTMLPPLAASHASDVQAEDRQRGDHDHVSLKDALAYLDLLARQKPKKLERAAVRWHGRLETEEALLMLAESQLAPAGLANLHAGEREAIEVLVWRLLRRVRPTLCREWCEKWLGGHVCLASLDRRWCEPHSLPLRCRRICGPSQSWGLGRLALCASRA